MRFWKDSTIFLQRKQFQIVLCNSELQNIHICQAKQFPNKLIFQLKKPSFKDFKQIFVNSEERGHYLSGTDPLTPSFPPLHQLF